MQVTRWPAMVQEPPVTVADWGATPASRSSLTTSACAGFGPELETVIVDVTTAPTAAGSGVVRFVRCRSANAVTGVRVSLPT